MDSLARKAAKSAGSWHKLMARLRGVEFLGSCSFQGRPRFRLHTGARIVIGSRCEFLSSRTANLIGINHPCIISAFNRGTEVHLGENSGFSGTVIAAFAGITIGRNVKCGANTLITDSDWHPEDRRSGTPKPVRIGDNVWLGVNAVVLKGVTIGENSVIGANSVVTKSIPANCMAAGNPCEVIKELSNFVHG